MDKQTHREKQDHTEQAAPQKKRPRFLLRAVLALLVLAVAAAAVTAVVYRDRLNADSIRRWFRYRSLTLSDSGQAESFPYEGDITDTFASLDGDLLVCSRNTISLYSASGTRYVSQSVSMEHPAVMSNGSLAVVYDAGGSELHVLGQRQLIWSGEGLDTILSARLNQSGMLTVVTQPGSARGTVTVYGSDYAPLVTVRLTSAYVLDAALSDDGKTLAIVTVGQEGGTFSSALSLYTLNTSADGEFVPDRTCSLGSGVVLDARHTASAFWAISDRDITVTDRQGATACADFDGRYLKRYTLDGDGFVAALLGKYRSGSQAELWIVSADGGKVTKEYREQVLALSAAGRYVAVLTGSRLDIYTKDLTLYASLEDTQGARDVLLREDGSAILIAPGTAHYYVP